MKRFSMSATVVSDRSITKVNVYPPLASNTLFDAVAMNEATIALKVIIAILFEKCFIPKKDRVYAELIVEQVP